MVTFKALEMSVGSVAMRAQALEDTLGAKGDVLTQYIASTLLVLGQ